MIPINLASVNGLLRNGAPSTSSRVALPDMKTTLVSGRFARIDCHSVIPFIPGISRPIGQQQVYRYSVVLLYGV